MTQTPEATSTDTAELLAALVAQVEAENAELIELPEPEAVTAFPTVL